MKQKAISATYLSAYFQCLLKFYFRYHTDKEQFVSGEHLAFGSAVHEALEETYKKFSGRGKELTEEDYNYVYSIFLKAGAKNNLSDTGLYEEGRQILKKKLDSFDPNEKTLGVELKFGFGTEDSITVSTKKGTPLVGAIDRVWELDEDTIVILDYKTSRTALTEKEAAVDKQLSLYDLVGSIVFPQYKNRILVLDYLRLGPVVTSRTEEHRLMFSDLLDTVYEEVSKLTEKDIKPRLNEFCGWCGYRQYCPSYQKAISDPDLLVKPLELHTKEEFVDEWSRFSSIRRLIEGYKQELNMYASNVIRESEDSEIVGSKTTLYKVQNIRVSYDPTTILQTIPKEDCPSLISVNKAAVDKYLLYHPELACKIEETAKASFASSFFKEKKNK